MLQKKFLMALNRKTIPMVILSHAILSSVEVKKVLTYFNINRLREMNKYDVT